MRVSIKSSVFNACKMIEGMNIAFGLGAHPYQIVMALIDIETTFNGKRFHAVLPYFLRDIAKDQRLILCQDLKTLSIDLDERMKINPIDDEFISGVMYEIFRLATLAYHIAIVALVVARTSDIPNQIGIVPNPAFVLGEVDPTASIHLIRRLAGLTDEMILESDIGSCRQCACGLEPVHSTGKCQEVTNAKSKANQDASPDAPGGGTDKRKKRAPTGAARNERASA